MSHVNRMCLMFVVGSLIALGLNASAELPGQARQTARDVCDATEPMPSLVHPALADAIRNAEQALVARRTAIEEARDAFAQSQEAALRMTQFERALQQSKKQMLQIQLEAGSLLNKEPSKALPKSVERLRQACDAFSLLLSESETAQKNAWTQCQGQTDTLVRKLASLKGSLAVLRGEIAGGITGETEAWSEVRMHLDRLARIKSTEQESKVDFEACEAARESSLQTGLEELNRVLADCAPRIDASGDAAIQEASGAEQTEEVILAQLNQAIGELRDAYEPVLEITEDAVEAVIEVEPIREETLVVAQVREDRELPVKQMPASAPRQVIVARNNNEKLMPVAGENRLAAHPAHMEHRIARLATELQAVQDAEPVLIAESANVMAAMNGTQADVGAALTGSGSFDAAPGKRAAHTKEPMQLSAAWRTVPSLSTILDAVAVSEVAAEDVVETFEAVQAPAEAMPVDVEQVLPASPVSAPVSMPVGNPLARRVDIDFRDMDLSHVVGLLADMAHINVVAGTEVSGFVTARLTDVTLRQAMDTALRLNGLGIVEEDGIYRILPYEEVVAAGQIRRIVHLQNSQADDIKMTMDELILSMSDNATINVTANSTTNLLIVSGPEKRVDALEDLIYQLDVSKPALPTVTEAIKINYADPAELIDTIQAGLLSEESGRIAADRRGRHIIVTDVPVRIEQIRSLIESLDQPVKDVSIDAMIVDVNLTDDAETGVDWFMEALRRQNERGETVGNLQRLDLTSALPTASAGQLAFELLSGDMNVRAMVSAEVRDNRARIVANPCVRTVENKKAQINISSEVPYEERTQSVTGPPMTSTGFKDIGTVLEVTPSVTHDDHILVEVDAKQSSQGEMAPNGIPTELKREAKTSLRMKNGQTIFIGGLRGTTNHNDVSKVPILGDVPVVNFLFKQSSVRKQSTELLIFLTCKVLEEDGARMTPYQQSQFDEFGDEFKETNSQKELFHTVVHPNEKRSPLWRRNRR